MLTNLDLVAFCEKMIGRPYWYGCVVYKCTQSLLERKAKQYPSHYSSSRMPKYKKKIAEKEVCMDCVGLIKGFMWTNGGVGVAEAIGKDSVFKNSYQSNGCPDTSANGMLSYCKSKKMANGKMSTMPETIGLGVFKSGHVGVYIGNGYVIEAKGFNYGVVKSKLKDTPWTDWAVFPFLSYVVKGNQEPEKPVVTPAPAPTPIPAPVIKNAYTLLGDEVNVRVGPGTKFKSIGKMDKGQKAEKLIYDSWTPIFYNDEVLWMFSKYIADSKVTGNGVNVRKGPATTYARVAALNKKAKVEVLNITGWKPVIYGGKIAWIFDKYLK